MRKLLVLVVGLAGCSTTPIGRAPEFSPQERTVERQAMFNPSMPDPVASTQLGPTSQASLWTRDRGSLLGDRRAMQRGDIMTVVIEIDDSAEISNSSARSRSASQ